MTTALGRRPTNMNGNGISDSGINGSENTIKKRNADSSVPGTPIDKSKKIKFGDSTSAPTQALGPNILKNNTAPKDPVVKSHSSFFHDNILISSSEKENIVKHKFVNSSLTQIATTSQDNEACLESNDSTLSQQISSKLMELPLLQSITLKEPARLSLCLETNEKYDGIVTILSLHYMDEFAKTFFGADKKLLKSLDLEDKDYGEQSDGRLFLKLMQDFYPVFYERKYPQEPTLNSDPQVSVFTLKEKIPGDFPDEIGKEYSLNEMADRLCVFVQDILIGKTIDDINYDLEEQYNIQISRSKELLLRKQITVFLIGSIFEKVENSILQQFKNLI